MGNSITVNSIDTNYLKITKDGNTYAYTLRQFDDISVEQVPNMVSVPSISVDPTAGVTLPRKTAVETSEAVVIVLNDDVDHYTSNSASEGAGLPGDSTLIKFKLGDQVGYVNSAYFDATSAATVNNESAPFHIVCSVEYLSNQVIYLEFANDHSLQNATKLAINMKSHTLGLSNKNNSSNQTDSIGLMRPESISRPAWATTNRRFVISNMENPEFNGIYWQHGVGGWALNDDLKLPYIVNIYQMIQQISTH